MLRPSKHETAFFSKALALQRFYKLRYLSRSMSAPPMKALAIYRPSKELC
jgi:hypothetical protein